MQNSTFLYSSIASLLSFSISSLISVLFYKQEPGPIHLEDQMIIAPEKVLHTRVITRDGQQTPQGLIKWVNMPEEAATWEDRTFISAHFPEIPLSWGQESAQGGVIVTYFRKKKKNSRKNLGEV
ncbi:hypothetical protein MANES_12G056360v8 [Manihot esculenta]|uniref:Uncharacterized protein n=1 Tax=Manihot esculenta TaxID=3983 RepID=A0ACB7GQX0_MANES|nr:hypothetical protein MANES_12G056360v8 [Manihot esculenta]